MNPRLLPWQGSALPLSYSRSYRCAPLWRRGPESNRRHQHFQCCALPTELPRLSTVSYLLAALLSRKTPQEDTRAENRFQRMPPFGGLGLQEAVRRSDGRTGFWILPFTFAAWIAPRPQQVGLSVIPPVSSFPRRRESPVARLDAPLGELPPLAVMPQKQTEPFWIVVLRSGLIVCIIIARTQ